MAENLTDVDQFDATISMPTSGETVSAADLRDRAIQRLANRTYNSKLRLDGHDTDIDAMQQYAEIGVTPGSTSATTVMPISLDYWSGGFSVASNQLTFPAVGDYEVSGSLLVDINNATNPNSFNITVRVNSSIVFNMVGVRYSATTTDNTLVVSSPRIVTVSNVAHKLDVYNPNVNTVTVNSFAGFNVITVRRIA